MVWFFLPSTFFERTLDLPFPPLACLYPSTSAMALFLNVLYLKSYFFASALKGKNKHVPWFGLHYWDICLRFKLKFRFKPTLRESLGLFAGQEGSFWASYCSQAFSIYSGSHSLRFPSLWAEAAIASSDLFEYLHFGGLVFVSWAFFSNICSAASASMFLTASVALFCATTSGLVVPNLLEAALTGLVCFDLAMFKSKKNEVVQFCKSVA